MRLLFFCLLLLLNVSCQEEKVTKSSEEKVTKSSTKSALPKEIQEEDCDDKIKKLEEKIPEPVSLQGGDTGCSLDELGH